MAETLRHASSTGTEFGVSELWSISISQIFCWLFWYLKFFLLCEEIITLKVDSGESPGFKVWFGSFFWSPMKNSIWMERIINNKYNEEISNEYLLKYWFHSRLSNNSFENFNFDQPQLDYHTILLYDIYSRTCQVWWSFIQARET